MSLLIQSRNSYQFSSLKPDKIRQNLNPFGQGRQIQEQLCQCGSTYLTNLSQIIQQWKTTNLVNYKQMRSKVDQSLASEITKITLEQISIDKEQIIILIREMREKILKKSKPSFQNAFTHQNIDQTILLQHSKQRSNSFAKTRSKSGQFPKRKLSKNSIFSEAKRINVQQKINNQSMIKTNSVNVFYNCNKNQGSRIKKVCKKETNTYDILKATNTSSNFMLNYLNKKENFHPNNFNCVQKNNLNKKVQTQQLKNKLFAQKVFESQEQKYCNKMNIELEKNTINESQTYKNLMINFQQKISKKLDDLMVKYTKIEEKLQVKQKSAQNIDIQCFDSKQKVKQNTVSIQSSFVSNQMLSPPQAAITSLKNLKNNQTSNTFHINNTLKKQTNDQNKIKHLKQSQPIKKHIRFIDSNNKTIKNKSKIMENFQESFQQEIVLKTQKQSQNEQKERKIKQAKEQQVKIQAKRLETLLNNQSYFQSLILQFFSITQKVILPISKQLLYIVVIRYQDFCKANNLQRHKQIISIETKKLEHLQKEYKDLLEKIEKVIDSKCEKSKKQKLLMYFYKFTQVVSSYDFKQNLIVRQSQSKTELELKQKIQQLKLQITS